MYFFCLLVIVIFYFYNIILFYIFKGEWRKNIYVIFLINFVFYEENILKICILIIIFLENDIG